jgi:hypothetical protein
LLIEGEFMSIVGKWTLNYSFGCSGSYNQSTVTFAANGTFTTGDGFSGHWYSLAGDVQWEYEPTFPSVIYSGNVVGGAMNGIMKNYKTNVQGCWYATISPIPAQLAAEKVEKADTLDSSGAAKK